MNGPSGESSRWLAVLGIGGAAILTGYSLAGFGAILLGRRSAELARDRGARLIVVGSCR